MLLDRFEAERAIVTGPGEHDADRMLLLILGQRVEKNVDRRALAVGGSGAAKLKPCFADCQDRAGG